MLKIFIFLLFRDKKTARFIYENDNKSNPMALYSKQKNLSSLTPYLLSLKRWILQTCMVRILLFF